METVKIAAEHLGQIFVAVNLGKSFGLVESGSAEVEEHESGKWSVVAHALGADGYTSRHSMPDSYDNEGDAAALRDSINAAAAELRDA